MLNILFKLSYFCKFFHWKKLLSHRHLGFLLHLLRRFLQLSNYSPTRSPKALTRPFWQIFRWVLDYFHRKWRLCAYWLLDFRFAFSRQPEMNRIGQITVFEQQPLKKITWIKRYPEKALANYNDAVFYLLRLFHHNFTLSNSEHE